MTFEELKEILTNIKAHYQNFAIYDYVVEEWYKVLKDYEYEKKKIQERLEMGIPVSQEKPHYRLHQDVHPVSGKANIGNDQAAG